MADKRVNFLLTAQDKTKQVFSTVGAGLAKLSKAAVAFGAAIGAATVTLGYMLKRMANAIDETGKLSRVLGISVKDMETFKLAADLGGSSMETFARASRQLSKNVFDFVKRGTGEASTAFKELGITSGDLIPIMGDNVAVFDLVSNRFQQMENGAVKTALAVKLFGGRGAEMITVLEGGAGSLKQIADEAERFGLVLSDKQVRAVEQANDEFTRLFSVVTGVAKQITGELFPKLGEIAKQLRETVLVAIEDSFGSVQGFAKSIADKVSEFTKGASKGLVYAAKMISVSFVKFGSFALTFLDGFLGAVDALISAIKPLAEALADIKGKGLYNFVTGSDPDAPDNSPFGMAMEDFYTKNPDKRPPKTERQLQKEQTSSTFDSASQSIAGMRKGLGQTKGFLEDTIVTMEGFFESASDWIENFTLVNETALQSSDQLTESLDKNKQQFEENDKAANTLNSSMERLANASDEFGMSIAKNFEDAILKAKSFEDALGAVADELLRIAFRKTVTEPLAEGISSFFSGFFSGGSGGEAATANADGNVFQSGKIIPFAKGGIVSSPTLFPMAGGTGLMGEDGEEAIMPLKRGKGGKLGVSASGINNAQVVNVNVIDQRSKGADVEVSEGRDSQGNRQISVLIRDEVRKGFADGAFDKSLSVFGVQRGALRRA